MVHQLHFTTSTASMNGPPIGFQDFQPNQDSVWQCTFHDLANEHWAEQRQQKPVSPLVYVRV